MTLPVPGVDVGGLLRRHRRRAGLTLDELAKASGVSVRAISDLERSRARGPQARTITALADGLSLDGPARAELLATARQGRRRRLPELPGLCALPPDVPDFVGRDAELTALDRLADPATRSRLVVVSGAGGLGKSALAVHAASRLAAAFPGGVLHVDLHGLEREPLAPREALGRLLEALGVRDVPVGLAERSELYGRLLTQRPVLVVLDNARAEAQVRPLVVGDGLSTVLLTSRRLLSGLPHAQRLVLEPMSDADALTLLAGAGAGANSRDDVADLVEIVRLCGNYPLALRIVGNLLLTRPAWTPADLVRRLTDSEHRVRQLRAGDLEVDAALALSYDQLDDVARSLFRRLSLAHAGASAAAAAVLAEVDERDAEHVLEELVELNLLVSLPDHRVGMHDLVAVWAAARLTAEETPAQRARAATRLRDWLLGTATAAGRLFDPDRTPPADGSGAGFPDLPSADRWLRAEEPNWVHALGEAAGRGEDATVVEVAGSLHWFAERWRTTSRQRWPSWVDVFSWSSAAARHLEDDRSEAVHRNHLAWAFLVHRRLDEASSSAARAGELARATGDHVQQAWSHHHLGTRYLLGEASDVALTHFDRAVELFQAHSDPVRATSARMGRAMMLNRLGRHAEGLAGHRDLLLQLEDPGLPLPVHLRDWHRRDALHGLGDSLAGLGDLDAAEAAHRRGVAAAERLATATSRGRSQQELARLLHRKGDLPGSRAAWQAARAEFTQADDYLLLAEVEAELAALDAAGTNG